ncbi:multidrug ABC transporter permease [Candidatus Micrarchaeota archaeon CG08_land_8_20_14_0_20_59_11]|nr:MAG: multidrug ABC transporter permease [Candidatus Micrarchaeota archaeon CG08_land_8_20_14_0_20_59_11]
MSEFTAIRVLWKRELLRFVRAKSRIAGSLGMPLFFLLFLGTGLNSAFSGTGGNYMEFIAPGIIGMVLMFSSVSSGMIVIMDRQFGFLKEILVAPISRLSIVAGKIFGGATTSILQAAIIMALMPFLGVSFNLSGMLAAFAFMVLISTAFVGLGIAIASKMEDMHGFQLVMNFLVMPLFFLSGALFPLNNLPGWLKVLTLIDPLTYGIDGMRGALTGSSAMPFWVDFGVLALFCGAMFALGAWLFTKKNS